eukprot:420578-Hanusia_phi.AAC.1
MQTKGKQDINEGEGGRREGVREGVLNHELQDQFKAVQGDNEQITILEEKVHPQTYPSLPPSLRPPSLPPSPSLMSCFPFVCMTLHPQAMQCDKLKELMLQNEKERQ